MATYVMSDIHGCYDEFCQMLNLIEFSDKDFMYILGDILDRGPKSYEVYNKVKNSKNICLLQGNHEKMLVDAVENKIDYWERNGRYQTEKSFYQNIGSWDFLGEVHDYFQNLPLWKELKIGGKKFFLFTPELIIRYLYSLKIGRH